MNNSVLKKQYLTTGRQSSVKRIVYLLVGHLLFGLGIIGILLPVMPTTVFWIGAAACYLKSSPEHYRALIAKGRTGKIIVNYLQHGVIGATEKKFAMTGMIFSSIVLLFLPIDDAAKLFSIIGMLFAAAYVLTRPGEI
jgi:uncharacterized membrane protein YbaN (DUF454 family)